MDAEHEQQMLPIAAFIDADPEQGNDTRPIRQATIDDLDLEKVAAHIQRALDRNRYTGPVDPLGYLTFKRCVLDVDGVLYATLAGIVCFGRTPQRFFPHAVIDIGHYAGYHPVSFDVVHLEKDIGGTIFDQLARVEAYIWMNTHHGMTLDPRGGFARLEVDEYPRSVIRELTVNALAHRDYLLFGSSCRVMLFKNRIEWASPGGLPPQVTIHNLLHIQRSRNPVVLSILYEAGYVEAFGQGLDTVVRVLMAEGLEPPLFQDFGAAFNVTVMGRVRDLIPSEHIIPLSESQRAILNYVYNREDASPAELLERFVSEDRSVRSIQRDISYLAERSLIEQVGKARSTRYRRPRDLQI